MTDLITWNGIQHYTIHPGQQLLVRPTVLSADGKRHQVLPNDSVWSISHKYGIAMSDFVKWNNIKNNVIHPGQNLLIRPVASAKPVSPSQPASTTTSAKMYTVKAGDSVWLIAHNHGISMDDLVKWNNIKNDTIHPGQQVVVKPANPAKSSDTSQATSATSAKTYTVKAGDSVWLIAHNHGISMDDLVKWNNIKIDTIHPGQQVVVKPANPAKSSDTSQATSATSAQTYTVKAGDSVWLIAHNHGISMDDLIKWNHITNNLIHPGQTVIVSEAGVASSQQKDKTYTVQPGDSVWLIASIHGISMEELIALNDIKDYTIHPNQTLIVESITNKEAKKAAEELGYRKVNELSKSGKPIFENKKKKPRYISPDRDGHGGGVWKGADKLDDIRSDITRKGTYDKDLNRIRD